MEKNKRFLYFFKKSFVSQKGMALLATLIFVFILTTIGIALLTMTRNEIKLSVLQEESTKAFYLAEAGVERAINWLELQGTPPGDGDFPSDFDGTIEYGELNTGKYTVNLSLNIDPDLAARYIIKTEGWIIRDDNSKSTRKIETAVRITNFAEYAYFSNDESFPYNTDIPGSTGQGGYAGSKIWFTGNDTLGGKVHSNSQFHMVDVPIFLDRLTSTALTIDFWGDAYLEDGSDFPGFADFDPDPDPPTTPGDYGLDVEEIPLPLYREISDLDDVNSLQRIAGGSWSKSDIQDLSDGVYIPNVAGAGSGVSGGIYIQGDATDIKLDVDGSAGNNSQITVDQGGNNTIITSYSTVTEPITLPDGSTIYAPTTLVYEESTDTYTSYQGITNGLLFIDGSINSLHGDNHRGKMTIASNESINVTDNIYYYDRDETVSVFEDAGLEAMDDSLGLIAVADLVIDRNAPHNIEVDAIIMALHTSFFYDGWRDVSKGTLSLLGGLIQEARGPVGTHSAGTKITGYSKNYQYDTRMANPAGGDLPPFFPTTGHYEKIYWKEVY